VNKSKNSIPNVIGHRAFWFIGKIRMRLGASDAPAAMKCRTVEQVNKVKLILYNTHSVELHVMRSLVAENPCSL
jgi:hypothetical protein